MLKLHCLLSCTILRFYSVFFPFMHTTSCGMLPILGFPQYNEEEDLWAWHNFQNQKTTVPENVTAWHWICAGLILCFTTRRISTRECRKLVKPTTWLGVRVQLYGSVSQPATQSNVYKKHPLCMYKQPWQQMPYSVVQPSWTPQQCKRLILTMADWH